MGSRPALAGLLRESVFGMNDGLVTTMGLVAGLTMEGATHVALLAAGLAAVWAAVVSMGLGSYLATHTEVGHQMAQIRRERWELADHPEEELEEMRQIYTAYGFRPPEVAVLLRGFQRNPELWLRLMVRDELGILPERFEHPWRNASVMAASVCAGSLPPLLPYFVIPNPETALWFAMGLGAGVAVAIGIVTSRFVGRAWWRGGGQFLVVVGAAAVVGSLAGTLIHALLRI